MTDLQDKQVKTSLESPERDANGRLLPGHTANPNGRPKGKTIKEMVREYLDEHPEDMEGFIEHFVKAERGLAWQMMEGRPSQGIGQDPTLGEIKFQLINYGDNPTSPQV